MKFGEFVSALNDSSWMGMISEVGVGVPFTFNYLNIPGASKTILHTTCPYHKDMQPFSAITDGYRSVSKEAVRLMANGLELSAPNHLKTGERFYLAISGCHKSSQDPNDSHFWICLKTSKDNSENYHYLHGKLAKFSREERGTDMSRGEAGLHMTRLIGWFMQKVLLKPWQPWSVSLKELSKIIEDAIFIDVIDAPDMSFQDHLELITFKNPVVFHNGQFHRVTDYIRSYDRFMSGSFNPVHKQHIKMANGALMMLDFENARKEQISATEVEHRVKMLDAMKQPVLISRGQVFIAFQALLLRSLGKKNFTMVMGTDTFNAVTDPKYIPIGNKIQLFSGLTPEQEITARHQILTEFLKPLNKTESGDNVKIEVVTRNELEVPINEWNEKMDYVIREEASNIFSSTMARDGDYSGLSSEVIKYIKKHKLYGEPK